MKKKLLWAISALCFLAVSGELNSKVSFYGAQLDGEAIDVQVHKAARAKKVDPKRYLLAIRKNPDGTRVFRQIGMYVIIAPNGEKRFLPDEI